MWKHYFEELFSFSPSQFRGILILLILIAIATTFKKYLENRPAFTEEELSAFNHRVDSFEKMYASVSVDSNAETPDPVFTAADSPINNAIQLFDFNPNTISAEDWKKLDVADYLIERILHYEEKGGRFRTAEDLKKIYGFPDDLFQKLKPFIKIPASAVDSNHYQKRESIRPAQEDVSIDINSADTSVLQKLPGIGSKLAARIVKYRQKLGGFYSISQLTEVYGISADLFARIKSKLILSGAVRSILINIMPYDSLAQQPYLKMLASKIIRCRKQNGDFHSLGELQSCAGISDSIMQKISHYVSLR